MLPSGIESRTVSPTRDEEADVTQLLQQWSGGHREALDPLFARIYSELRGLARSQLRRENRNHTLQPTELVHEAFARLVVQKVSWQNRNHFFGIAAKCMRRILVDHARRKKAAKRPAVDASVELNDDLAVYVDASDRILAVNEALDALTETRPRLTSIVELKFFAGFSIDEIAATTGVSPATVKRDWDEAKRLLHARLQGG
jgi:RNA polymerase sigma factor (TIGR02999 family)